MNLFDILYTILLGPLQWVFENIYVIANRVIGHPGLSIVVLSLIMNFLVLPLYKRSDAMQEEARDVEEKLSKGVNHIKKTFSGDERMMILQTYYRQNNYKPTDALNGSVSLLLEVPFFMAAYQFLSHLELIQGVSLGPIADLGAPDAMLSIGGISINVLPILMTLVNVISSAIYLKGFPLKTKIQLYGMALFFLVFLYTSPAGLVFYWTLNNVFSLVKTIFYKLKNPKKVATILASIVGVAAFVFGIVCFPTLTLKRKLFAFGMGVILQMPLILGIAMKKKNFKLPEIQGTNDKKLFVLGCLFLTVLVGGLIPSTIISASPQEFIDITYLYNPVWYIVNTLCLSAGTFLVWMGVFYWIASPKGKVIFDKLVWILCGIMLVNYMFFGTDLGMISTNLQYENGMYFSTKDIALNALILVAVGAVMYLILSIWKDKFAGVVLTALIAVVGMTGLNVVTIQGAVSDTQKQLEAMGNQELEFNLSKDGKNVVVLMLDRAQAAYLPYIMNEKPELKEQFAGFTFYSNTISFGGCTNFGTPPLFGGYEYTPIEMNKREDEALVDKHNEAIKVLPVLFYQNGYDVTLCDVPYANYQMISDMSIYDEYPGMDTYLAEGTFVDEATRTEKIEMKNRSFFCFSIMKCMPLVLQESLYDKGSYNRAEKEVGEQIWSSPYTAQGINSEFVASATVLENFANFTHIVDDDSNTFLMMSNSTTHEPALLQTPNYDVAATVDNREYYEKNAHLFTIDGQTLKMETDAHLSHYQINVKAMMLLGEWFDYLRENDVYDNTRIIIVADHGSALGQIESFVYDETMVQTGDFNFYYPLLLVKDFDSDEFTTADTFMTTADVPIMALQDLIQNPVNPFTGKEITDAEKYAHDQYIIASPESRININNGNQYLPAEWFAIKDNIWDLANWRHIKEVTTMPEECK